MVFDEEEIFEILNFVAHVFDDHDDKYYRNKAELAKRLLEDLKLENKTIIITNKN